MNRNFGIMSGRSTPWGHSGDRPSASRDAILPRDLNPSLPSGSILKPSDAFDTLADVSPALAVGQATIDFLKVVAALLFVGVTGFGIGVSIFILFFVELR